jgi:hypothetical protein
MHAILQKLRDKMDVTSDEDSQMSPGYLTTWQGLTDVAWLSHHVTRTQMSPGYLTTWQGLTDVAWLSHHVTRTHRCWLVISPRDKDSQMSTGYLTTWQRPWDVDWLSHHVAILDVAQLTCTSPPKWSNSSCDPSAAKRVLITRFLPFCD